MITFSCRCSEPFEVPDELAGSSFQCPACGLLVDVPTLDDLRGLGEDGSSYRLNENPNDSTADTYEQLPIRVPVGTRADTPHVATRGDATDRRLSLSEFLKVGTTDDDLLEIKGEVVKGVPTHPKYDPDTGELIVPLDVRVDTAKLKVAAPVLAGPAVLAYEQHAATRLPSIWMPLWEMFRLPNLLVCAIVAGIHYLNMLATGVGLVFFFLVILALPVLLITIAHFANIVDETGPTGVDEMPRPMRGGSFYEDFLRPLLQVMFAYALVWVPVVILNHYVPRLPPFASLGMLLFLFTFVPAFLITLITSGALNNMLPHRVLSVIPAASWHYWVAVLTGIVATITFLFGTLMAVSTGNRFATFAFFGPVASAKQGTIFGVRPIVELLGAPLLVVGSVYLIHVFCWQMGLIYRMHHERFAWVLQKHDMSARTDTIAQLHVHRQKQAEARAARARKHMDQRIVATKAMPIAKPVDPRR